MEHSPYQEKLIKNYYRNRELLMWQKLSDLISELYLAEGKKRVSLWKRVATTMKNLGMSSEKIEYVVSTDNPAILAQIVQKNVNKDHRDI
ncbi:MAG: hypothetical protein LBJ67_09740 [Planctomycetaceae bacterium]|jgi:hypothetical protein|nr:hypothetical protein [Planctomycetaceae bacterium]